MGADAVIVGTAVLEAALAGPETLDALLRELRAVEISGSADVLTGRRD